MFDEENPLAHSSGPKENCTLMYRVNTNNQSISVMTVKR